MRSWTEFGVEFNQELFNEITFLFLSALKTFPFEITKKLFLSEPANFSAYKWLGKKFSVVQKRFFLYFQNKGKTFNKICLEIKKSN